jgi:hypothetical protein
VHCPKCGADLPDAGTECPRCHVVVAKYLARNETLPVHIEQGAHQTVATADGDEAPQRFSTLLLGVELTTSLGAAVGRGIFLLLLALWTTALVGGVNAERVNSSFLHLPNLAFHEAGHILFLPFGPFMTVLGGSLTQVLVPLVCAGTFLWHTRDAFGAAVATWWAGENLIDLAPYINDARDLQLVLLGGKTGAEVEGHDWEYLLNTMGLASKDHVIASLVQAVGIMTMIAALIWGAVVVFNQIAILRSSPD